MDPWGRNFVDQSSESFSGGYYEPNAAWDAYQAEDAAQGKRAESDWGAWTQRNNGYGMGGVALSRKIAQGIGMTPKEHDDWLNQYVTSMGGSGWLNNADNAGNVGRALLQSKGINPAPYDNLFTQATQQNSGYNDQQIDLNGRWNGNAGIAQVLKGIGFALTPAVLGPALQGTAALGAANFGGGLAGDVLSGSGLKFLRGGLSLAGTGLNALNGGASDTEQSLSGSVLSPQASSVLSPQTTPMTTPTTTPETLSNSVMSISSPRTAQRPQIRLSPGFRRGA